jgi:hypothetical protein
VEWEDIVAKRKKRNQPDSVSDKFERYLSFKLRFIEALDLAKLRKQKAGACKQTKVGHDCGSHVVHTLQSSLYTWVAGLYDKDPRSANVFDVWKECFESEPEVLKIVRNAEAKVKPGLELIRTFRNKQGAHADLFGSSIEIQIALAKNQRLIEQSIGYFLIICETLVHEEKRIFPDFDERLKIYVKAHSLNDMFSCRAMSKPRVREVTLEVGPASHPYPRFEIRPVRW